MTELSKEQTRLEKTVNIYEEYKQVLEDIEAAKEMLKDKDMAEFAKEELEVWKNIKKGLLQQMFE